MKSIRYIVVIITLIIVCYSQHVWSKFNMNSLQPDDISTICINSQASSHNDQELTENSETIIVTGDYLKAAMKAGEEFQKYIKKELKGSSSPAASHMADIINYSITIRKVNRGEQYLVQFAPLPFQGSPIKGGGIVYFIDSKSFKILKKELLI